MLDLRSIWFCVGSCNRSPRMVSRNSAGTTLAVLGHWLPWKAAPTCCKRKFGCSQPTKLRRLLYCNTKVLVDFAFEKVLCMYPSLCFWNAANVQSGDLSWLDTSWLLSMFLLSAECSRSLPNAGVPPQLRLDCVSYAHFGVMTNYFPDLLEEFRPHTSPSSLLRPFPSPLNAMRYSGCCEKEYVYKSGALLLDSKFTGVCK